MKTPREVAEQIMNDALKGGILNSPSIVDRIESAILAERERWRAFADDIDHLIDKLRLAEQQSPLPFFGLSSLIQIRDAHAALAAAANGGQ